MMRIFYFKIDGYPWPKYGPARSTDTEETLKERISRVFNVGKESITILEIVEES